MYEHLVYDGHEHASLLRHDELYARAFVVSSFGKTYHVTGWKTGYVVAPPALSAELRKVHQYVSFAGVTPLQWALADYMAAYPQHVDELPGFYQAKRDLFCGLLAESRLRFTPTPSTYFQLADYSAIRPDLDDVAMSLQSFSMPGKCFEKVIEINSEKATCRILEIINKKSYLLKTAFLILQTLFAFLVIHLGLEPRTPSLKGMCSTC